MTIKQTPEPRSEKEEHLWILGKLEISLMKMEDQNVLTAMYMDIWWENIGTENQREDTSGKPWTSRYKISRAIMDDVFNQKKLLVARNQERC